MKAFFTFVLTAIVVLSYAQECPPGEVACSDGECIPESWICDGQHDCPKGEDEIGCPPCDGFACENGECLPESWICDGDPDCEGGEDEDQDCAPCEGFVCNDRNCIPDFWQCDGYEDCPDGEDELGCPCDGFLCDNGHCVPNAYVCDGDLDCRDGSDERNCTCAENEIACPKIGDIVICIRPYWICDNVKDCPDGWDEQNCTYTKNNFLTEKQLKFEQKLHKSIMLSHGQNASKSVSPVRLMTQKKVETKMKAKVKASRQCYRGARAWSL